MLQIPLSLKENKTLGEVGIVFKKSHRNIILVLPPNTCIQKVEKSVSKKDLISDEQLATVQKPDELNENNKQISVIQDPIEQSVEVKPEVPAKKKIIKVKTVKTGTKTVKIKSEKTTTTTLENGVTEVKKKTIKKQTDTTTIQLPNGVTNGVTSEECIVTNSIRSTNGDHFEEQNIEITSSQSDGIDPVSIEEHSGLKDRRSSSSEFDDSKSSTEPKRLTLSINGFEGKSLVKNRSPSPIEIASYNFVVGKKSSKRLSESESCLKPELDIFAKSEKELTTNPNCESLLEINGTLNDSSEPGRSIFLSDVQTSDAVQEISKNELLDEQNIPNSLTKTKTSNRSATSPARFQVKLNDSSTVQSTHTQKEANAPFLRSEVSPARFTIKLAKKKAETVEPKQEIHPKVEVTPEPEVRAEPKVCAEPEVCTEPEVCAKSEQQICVESEIFAKPEVCAESELEFCVKLEPEISAEPEVCPAPKISPQSDEVDLKTDVGPQVELNPRVAISHTEVDSEVKVESKVGVYAIEEPSVNVENLNGELVEDTKVVADVEAAVVEVAAKEIVSSKTETPSKVEANTTDVKPKIRFGRKADLASKSESDVGVKTLVGLKSKIGNKVEGESKPEVGAKVEVGLKEVTLKKTKKILDNKVTDATPTEGTTEVKKKLVKKVKDSTSPTGEIKKKVVKKVIGATTGATENGTGEVKKVVKKKSEVSTASDVVPEVKKIVKKKLESVVTQQEINAVEEQPKLNNIEDPKAEETEKPNIQDVEVIENHVENLSEEAKIESKTESKMDEDNCNQQNYVPPIDIVEKEEFDPTLPLSAENRKDRTMLGLDDNLALGTSTQKYYNETPLFISTTQPEQHDLVLPLSDKNRRDRQMLGMDEDLALGASASPVESKSETSNNYIPLAICDTPSSSTDYVGKLYSGNKV